MVDTTLIIGVGGMSMLLVAFLLNLLDRLDEGDPWYAGINCIGGALLAIYAYRLGSYPFLVLELVWAGSAGYTLIRSTGD